MSLFGSSTDGLLDLIRSNWSTPSWPTVTRQLVKVSVEHEMVIVPETPNGPMLEIVMKDGSGEVVFKQRLNLPAVDELIGKLIKMRDHMAQMK